MTVDVRPKGTGETLRELAKRLYRAEQQGSRPSGNVGIGDNPSVDTITIDGIVVGSAASPATNLLLSTGAHMEDIWIDANWSAPADGTAASYDVELSRKVGVNYELVNNFHITGGTSLRMSALEPNQIYGVRVVAINRLGVRATAVPSPGWADIQTAIDATIPSQVTGLTVSDSFRNFIVRWNEVADRDVARGTGTYEIHVASDAGFTNPDIFFTTGTVLAVAAFSGVTRHFRVRAVDNSGNAGPWSSTVSDTMSARVDTVDLSDVSVTTAKIANLAVDNGKLANLAVDAAKLADSSVESTKIANLAVGSAAIANLAVGTAKIADAAILTAKIGDLAVTSAKINDLAVTTAKIADLAVDDAKIANLDAAKITAGTINADRIAANSLDVNKLTTSTLTSKTITLGAGGTLKIGNAPTTGILINDQGIRLYSGSSVKVALDVAGTATFEGNISASTITSSTITSVTINSGTITGTTVRTAASGQRVALEAGDYDRLKLYTGNASETVPGTMLSALGGGSLILEIHAPRASTNDWSVGSFSATTSGVGCQCNWQIRSTSAVRATFGLASDGNTDTPSIYGQGIDELDLIFAGGSTNARARLRGSGNYGFLYLWGGGTTATLNCNNGLGAGFHVLDGNNSSFQPIQASAFTVSSAHSTKRDIRDEGEALTRLRRMRVVRFKRNYDDRMEDPPPHIQRFYELDEIGFLANEILEIMPEAVTIDETGEATGINLAVVLALLVKAVQEIGQQPGRS